MILDIDGATKAELEAELELFREAGKNVDGAELLTNNEKRAAELSRLVAEHGQIVKDTEGKFSFLSEEDLEAIELAKAEAEAKAKAEKEATPLEIKAPVAGKYCYARRDFRDGLSEFLVFTPGGQPAGVFPLEAKADDFCKRSNQQVGIK